MGRVPTDGAAMKPIQVMRYRGVTAVSSHTDDFNVNTLSQYTQYADVSANWSIANGYLLATTGVQSVLTRNGVSFADGQISAIITKASDTGLVLRLKDNSNYYVAVIVDGSSDVVSARNSVIVYKRVGGNYTTVGQRAGISSFVRGTPKNLSFSAVGNALTVKVDGVTYISATDSSITGAGLCGTRVNSEATTNEHSFDSLTWP